MNAISIAIVSLVSQLPWSILFMILPVGLHVSNNRYEINCIQRKAWASSIKSDGRRCGFMVGPWYICFVSSDVCINNSWTIATDTTYQHLVDMPKETYSEGQDKKELLVYERMGNFSNAWFKKRAIDMPVFRPRDSQKVAIEKIKDHFFSSGHTVAYIYGKPGIGKSILGPMIASSLDGMYCNTLRPWQPGDTLALLCSESNPSRDQPLVVVFDEVDLILMQLGQIPMHAKMPIAIQDKEGWNSFLDQIQWSMFPNVILLLTTNVEPQRIKDQSLVRPKRVDLIFEIK